MFEKLTFFRENSEQQMLYAHVKNDQETPNRFFKPTQNTQKIHLLILNGKYFMVWINYTLLIH